MVNGFRYYKALESVSIASALSTALTHLPMPDPSPSSSVAINEVTAIVTYGRTVNRWDEYSVHLFAVNRPQLLDGAA